MNFCFLPQFLVGKWELAAISALRVESRIHTIKLNLKRLQCYPGNAKTMYYNQYKVLDYAALVYAAF